MTRLFWTAQKEHDQNLQEQRQHLARLSVLAPEQAARELNRQCPYCGELLIPRAMQGPGGRVTWVFPDRHGCTAESEALAKLAVIQAEQAVEEDEQARRAILNRAGLIGWLGECYFENFQPRQDWPGADGCKGRVLAYLRALIDNTLPANKNWLILHGNYGNGKSHLAAAIVRMILPRRAYFRVWPDYLRRITATFERQRNDENQETEADIIAELQRGDLIVIDDLDKRRGTDFSRNTLYSVLNHRYNAQLPTILTFNYGPGDVDPKAPGRLALEEYLGRAVLDRVIGVAFDVVEFTGPSYRSGVTLAA